MKTDRPQPNPGATADPRVGLCSRCAHAIVQRNARGSAFFRCGAAEARDDLLRYPPLPVHACPAHTAGEPRAAAR